MQSVDLCLGYSGIGMELPYVSDSAIPELGWIY